MYLLQSVSGIKLQYGFIKLKHVIYCIISVEGVNKSGVLRIRNCISLCVQATQWNGTSKTKLLK